MKNTLHQKIKGSPEKIRLYYALLTHREMLSKLNNVANIFKSPKSQDFSLLILGKHLFTKSKPIIYGNNGNKMGIGGG